MFNSVNIRFHTHLLPLTTLHAIALQKKKKMLSSFSVPPSALCMKKIYPSRGFKDSKHVAVCHSTEHKWPPSCCQDDNLRFVKSTTTTFSDSKRERYLGALSATFVEKQIFSLKQLTVVPPPIFSEKVFSLL